MAVSQDTFVIADWDTIAVSERRRTTSSGTASRYTIDFDCKPITINADPRQAKVVADGIAEAVRKGIRAIAASASTSTQLFRKAAESAYDKGSQWASRRYKGGRMGPRRPNTATGGRLFNDSGRFAESITATGTRDGTYTVNVAANRLDPSTFTAAQFQAMLQKLVDHVPILRDTAKLLQEPDVRESLEKLVQQLAVEGRKKLGDVLGELRDTATQIGELGGAVGEMDE